MVIVATDRTQRNTHSVGPVWARIGPSQRFVPDNIQNSQIRASTPPEEFEPAIPVSVQPQTYVFEGVAFEIATVHKFST
jgi:hypothetical protein